MSSRERWLCTVLYARCVTTQQTTDSFRIDVILRACDGLNACTSSEIAAAEPDGIVEPDSIVTFLVLACTAACAGDTLEALPCVVS